jgi:integrase
MQAVKQAADGYRLTANSENDVVRNITMSAVLDRYEREFLTPYTERPLGAVDDGKISVQTAKSYRSYIRGWVRPRWEKYPISEFAKPQLRSAMETWLADLCKSGKLAPKTVRSIGSLMRLIFRRVVKWGYLASNPMDFVDLPEGSTRRKEKPRSLTPTEFLALLKLFGPRERLAVEIAGWLGTRRSEGFGLKWQDLDLDRCVVTFRQGFAQDGGVTDADQPSGNSAGFLDGLEEVDAILGVGKLGVRQSCDQWAAPHVARLNAG